MPFSTTSYLAGVGTVVAALAIGFSGGFLLAPSADHVEQNRLQRVASNDPLSNPASLEATTPKSEIKQVRSIELVAAPVSATQQPAHHEPTPAKALEPAPASAHAKAAEPARAAPEKTAANPEVNTEKMRAAEAKAERKRAREQRRAERRKQREKALAAAAAKRVLSDPPPQQFADRTEPPRFGFFGED